MYYNSLMQVVNEDKYAKREINGRIWKDLNECKNLAPVFNKLKAEILGYKAKYKHYWPSKKERCFILGQYNNTPDIMIYIAVGVMKASRGKPAPIQGVVEYVARRLEGFSNHMDAVRTASELIAVGALSDMYDTISARNSETGSLMIKSRWTLDASTDEYIADTMYLPPMLCPPNDITTNTNSGYLNPMAESVVLKAHNHHNEPLALDAINIANNVAFELDNFILDNFEETSAKPLDNMEKLRNFQLLKNSSKRVYNMLKQQGNLFWFSWRFDKRGRMYSQGYHVNIQSTEYKKALISLARKEHVEIKRSTT